MTYTVLLHPDHQSNAVLERAPVSDIILAVVTLGGSILASQHWDLGVWTGSLVHKAIACIEYCPILGGLVALIEYIVTPLFFSVDSEDDSPQYFAVLRDTLKLTDDTQRNEQLFCILANCLNYDLLDRATHLSNMIIGEKKDEATQLIQSYHSYSEQIEMILQMQRDRLEQLIELNALKKDPNCPLSQKIGLVMEEIEQDISEDAEQAWNKDNKESAFAFARSFLSWHQTYDWIKEHDFYGIDDLVAQLFEDCPQENIADLLLQIVTDLGNDDLALKIQTILKECATPSEEYSDDFESYHSEEELEKPVSIQS